MATSKKDIDKIVMLLSENAMVSGATTNLTGASYAQDMEDLGNPPAMMSQEQGLAEFDPSPTYTERDVRIAKRFIELAGGIDRAEDLLLKVRQSDEIFGFSQEREDKESISRISDAMPSLPDLPSDYVPTTAPSQNFQDIEKVALNRRTNNFGQRYNPVGY